MKDCYDKLFFRCYYYAINAMYNSGPSFTFSQTPPEKGWIVDGFPMTINQAKLFEKAYTGIDPETKDANSGKLSLVTDPRAPNKPPVTSPAFDVSVLLDISDTAVLKRLANLKCKFSTTLTK